MVKRSTDVLWSRTAAQLVASKQGAAGCRDGCPVRTWSKDFLRHVERSPPHWLCDDMGRRRPGLYTEEELERAIDEIAWESIYGRISTRDFFPGGKANRTPVFGVIVQEWVMATQKKTFVVRLGTENMHLTSTWSCLLLQISYRLFCNGMGIRLSVPKDHRNS